MYETVCATCKKRGSHTLYNEEQLSNDVLRRYESPTGLGIVSTSIPTHSGGVATTKVQLFPERNNRALRECTTGVLW